MVADQKYPEPPLLSGDDLYNSLMSDIEPELMLKEIPLLQKKYANETPEDRKKRALRYEKAFKEYDRQYAEYQKKWEIAFLAYKREAMQSLENEEREDDAAAMKNIEKEME